METRYRVVHKYKGQGTRYICRTSAKAKKSKTQVQNDTHIDTIYIHVTWHGTENMTGTLRYLYTGTDGSTSIYPYTKSTKLHRYQRIQRWHTGGPKKMAGTEGGTSIYPYTNGFQRVQGWHIRGTKKMAGTHGYLYTGTHIGTIYIHVTWHGTENMAGTHRYLYTGTYIGTSR